MEIEYPNMILEQSHRLCCCFCVHHILRGNDDTRLLTEYLPSHTPTLYIQEMPNINNGLHLVCI